MRIFSHDYRVVEHTVIYFVDTNIHHTAIHIYTLTYTTHRLRLGDTVHLSHLPDVKYAQSITIGVFADTIEGISGDVFEVFVKPYFKGKFRPVKKGDIFMTRGGMRSVEFKVQDVVVNTDSSDGSTSSSGASSDTSADSSSGSDKVVDYCIVGPDTEVIFDVKDALGECYA